MKDEEKFIKMPRDDVEKDLTFAGFATFKCETRSDSQLVIQALSDAWHSCIMVTGDAALTAYSVARETSIARRAPGMALIMSEDATEWTAALQNNSVPESIPFADPAEMDALVDKGHDLIITGKAIESAEEKFGTKFYKYLTKVCVFARMSPQQKEDIIRAIGGHVYDTDLKAYDETKRNKKILQHTLMCGDGGNDVGALKQADVGVALLTGFGNANVDVKKKKEETPSMLSSMFSAMTGEMTDVEKEALAEATESAEEKLVRLKKEEADRL